ncbi:RDD family protein [Rufibacter sp. LB8]|uniref:RDD family protein n=1 Tax=Rufibacter sp. LB8 TaxID=2777781 RepID=UPI001CEFAA08|nr:RDD family protein [Rufibacter sp. LB8]
METSTPYSFMDEFATDAAPPVYAGFWIRFAAFIIDGFVLMIPNWILSMFMVGGMAYMNPEEIEANPFAIIAAASSYMAASALLSILYKTVMESSSWQATLGKRALDLKVTTENGERLSFLRSLGRTLASYLSYFILFIGYIMAAFTSRKQALHDKIASTLVVKTR